MRQSARERNISRDRVPDHVVPVEVEDFCILPEVSHSHSKLAQAACCCPNLDTWEILAIQ